jgi:RNA polymerase sigma factor (sigma-70 family)
LTVRAAQAGERWALDELFSAHLPLVYNVVGRALEQGDIDDVVQQVMLQAVLHLPSLREPDSFRSWLLVITMRGITAHQARQNRHGTRTAPLSNAADLPDGAADFEELTILRLGLTGQRRDLVRAGRWLDGEERNLLALWFQESAGRLTRQELSDAVGVSLSHAGVRIHRLREHLDTARAVVAALSQQPRCAGLARAATGWEGLPGPLWRKRLARHVRDCVGCGRAGADRIPAERLLSGLGLVAVPAVLSGALIAKLLSPATASGPLTLMSAYPKIVALTAVTAVTAAAVTVLLPSDPEPRPPAAQPAPVPSPAAPSPSPSATALSLTGIRSLESAGQPGRFVTAGQDLAALERISSTSGAALRQRATFTVRPGLADPDCVSFRTADGRYLRHYAFLMKVAAPDGSALFREDATYCPVVDRAGRVTLVSHNRTTRMIHHRGGGELAIDETDHTNAFTVASSWVVREGLDR